MSSDDIVTRLRETEGGYTLRGILREAADEIERLRNELTASHESHGNEVGALTERLSLAIHERDDARIRVCELLVRHGGVFRRVGRENIECTTVEEIAAICKWDCFKEVRDER